jgi:CO dehydrogenase/acetyl-CoA synthase beta subunit
MSNLETYISKVAAYVQQRWDRHENIREFDTAAAVKDIRIGPGAGAELVLKHDTAVELGSPSTASCAFVLYSNDPDSVHGSRVTLIGPDIPEAGSGSIPFGQILMASGRSLTEDDYETLNEAQYVSDVIEGYMVRSSSTHIWARISQQASSKGFNFATLGHAIEQHVKAQLPRVEAVELVFVTASKEDVTDLGLIGAEVEQAARNIRQRVWHQRGVDIFECTNGGHCGKCSDKAVCDRIRGMIGQREGGPQGLPIQQAE